MKIAAHFFLIFAALASATSSRQLICYSKSIVESQAIYSFFQGSPAGLFVDVFPTHPIVDSNTVWLTSQGWRGVNLLSAAPTLSQFLHARKHDINVLTQLPSPAVTDPNQNANSQPFSQLCHTLFYQKPSFLSVQVEVLNSIIFSNDWQSEKCKPQFMLIRQYSQAKLPQSSKQKLMQYGYEQINSYQNFVVLTQANLREKFRQAEDKNKLALSGELIGLSRLLKGLGEKAVKKPVVMNEIVNGNVIPDTLSIIFAVANSNIDIGELVRENEVKGSKFMIMQFNPSTNALVLPLGYKSSQLKVSQLENYYHIESEDSTQYHLYIFDHGHQMKPNMPNYRIERLDGLGVPGFDGQQIKYYSIDAIQKLNQQDNSDWPVDAQQNKKQLEAKLRAMEDLLQASQRELSDARTAKQQAIQKQTQLEPVKPKDKSSSSDTSKKDSLSPISTPSSPATAPLRPESHIANLTPETMFANTEIKNATVFIVILVGSILGSIALTAVVTACVMKKKHKAQVRSRIKNNAEMHTDIQEVHTEQFSQEKFSVSAKQDGKS